MNQIMDHLRSFPEISGWKLNIRSKESYQLFFVKGALETVRCTDTCDKEVTVYVAHENYLGDASFPVYPSTTKPQLHDLIREAVEKAKLICNQPYELPAQEQGEFQVESNFSEFDVSDLAAKISGTVFDAARMENGSLNSLEIFVNRHHETVINSRGLRKSQTRYTAMVEAIPTYNGEKQSVELYEQYNFSSLDPDALATEIAGKMQEVKARYEAITPDFPMNCKVILGSEELSMLFMNIAGDLNYSSVYSHSNLFSKGDAIQTDPVGDKIGITMEGHIPGSVRSAMFDGDGLTLSPIRLVDGGKAVNYYGSNRYGQYLGEKPTGSLWCFRVDPGTAEEKELRGEDYLEIISMSGLQVDFYSDYIGGEIRLAYYHNGEKIIPVTGISISGKLKDVLNQIRFSKAVILRDGYFGPEKGVVPNMAIF